ncbi:MAG: hypothetical protein AB7S68_14360 [Polyangiaceae bacterium]
MTSRRQVLQLLLGFSAGTALPGCLVEAPPAPFENAPSRLSARQRMAELSQAYEGLMTQQGEAVLGVLTGGSSAEPFSAPRKAQARLFEQAERLLEYHEALLPPQVTRSWQLGTLGVALLEDAETQSLEQRLEAAQLATVSVGRESIERAQLESWIRAPEPEKRDVAVQALTELQRRCEPIAKELLLRRRARARELGEDYYEALLRVRRVPLTRLEELAQRFVRGTDDDARQLARTLQRVMRVGLGRRRGSFAPHDLGLALDRLTALPVAWFPRERATALAQEVATALGLSDAAREIGAWQPVDEPGRIGERLCLGETMSLPLIIPRSVKALVRPGQGLEHWRSVMLELGRVAQLCSVTEAEPVLKGYPWVPGLATPALDRGVAEAFAGLLLDPHFLEHHAQLPAPQVARVVRSLKLRVLFELRQRIAWMTFERRALANPRQDLNRLAGQVNARLSGLNSPVFWATDRRLPGCPGIEPAALIGGLLAFEVLEWLRGEAATNEDPVILDAAHGERLKANLLAPGTSRSIDERLIALLGRRLSARAAVVRLTSRSRRPPRLISL